MEKLNQKLISAIEKDDVDAVLDVLRAGGDPNSRDKFGSTPLMRASHRGNLQAVKILLENQADKDLQDDAGFYALHYAAQGQFPEIVKLLLDNGASVDLQDKHGNTALARSLATSQGNGDVIKLLLKHGADPEKKNFFDNSPFDTAQAVANYDLKQFFDRGGEELE